MKTILVVDDEFALVDTLKDFLEAVGYRVDVAHNGAEALEAIALSRPDLVITDLMMPIMGGKELLATIRADPALAAIPAILVSAARRQVAIPAGAEFPSFSKFLRKPFTLKPLMDAIAELIGPGG
ncbi:MAG TPA: response regulator [Kofleriaceae bacterium]|jgi:CheY-like chemotaxis protein|nr:response regulator [Polyangiales bacterium]